MSAQSPTTYRSNNFAGIPERNRSANAKQQPKEQPGSNSSQILLMKRFENDLVQVMAQFELEEDTYISEVQTISIMEEMGFIRISNNTDLEAVQNIFQHLQPVQGPPEQPIDENDEVQDNGERIIMAHLKVFLAAILGFNCGLTAGVSNPNSDLIGSIDE